MTRIAVAMRPRLIEWFFDAETRARLDALGQVRLISSWNDLHSGDAPAVLADTDVLVTGWGTGQIDEQVLDAAPSLTAVIHSAGSVHSLITPSCYDRGISVSSQAELNALPVAEFTLAMILLAGKDVFRAQHLYRQHRRPVDQHVMLAEAGNHRRTVGIVGASKIGSRVIQLLAPFDLDVVVYDPWLTDARADTLGVTPLALDELMATSTVVSLHAPMTDATRHMIGPRQLALLPDGATLINTARGGLVDQVVLVDELQAGRIKAVLDVTDPILDDPASPLWDLPNVVLTPHIAGALGNELHRLGAGVVDDVEQVARGGIMTKAISPDAFSQLA